MTSVALPQTDHPIISAPMAGGASTPELVAAVSDAGGFGYLAAGYLTAEKLAAQIRRTRELTDRPFGVNLFVPEEPNRVDLEPYRAELSAEAERYGLEVPQPDWDDTDHWAEKVALLVAEPVAVVSFTFGLPDADEVERLHRAGSALVGTVTTAAEAQAAAALGLDALCIQGPDAGGHRATHRMTDEPATTPLEQSLPEVRRVTDLPLIVAGGISDGGRISELLAAGAYACQLGSMFLRCDEAGTNETYRKALTKRRDTVVTRCYSGRYARGLQNRFIGEHHATAPAAYPQVNQLTGPIRKAAAAAGDADTLHLWAGTGYRRAMDFPAADIVAGLVAEM